MLIVTYSAFWNDDILCNFPFYFESKHHLLMLRSILYNVKVRSAMNDLLGSDFLGVEKNVYCRELSI